MKKAKQKLGVVDVSKELGELQGVVDKYMKEKAKTDKTPKEKKKKTRKAKSEADTDGELAKFQRWANGDFD